MYFLNACLQSLWQKDHKICWPSEPVQKYNSQDFSDCCHTVLSNKPVTSPSFESFEILQRSCNQCSQKHSKMPVPSTTAWAAPKPNKAPNQPVMATTLKSRWFVGRRRFKRMTGDSVDEIYEIKSKPSNRLEMREVPCFITHYLIISHLYLQQKPNGYFDMSSRLSGSQRDNCRNHPYS